MKKVIFVLLTILIFHSCKTMNLGENMKQIELGMSKQEVINVLGKNYRVESATQVYEGKLEVLLFQSAVSSDYVLYFLNDQLSEYHRHIQPTPSVQQNVNIERKSD